jgi:hypothetical protein
MTVLPNVVLPRRPDARQVKFQLGQLLITPEAMTLLEDSGVSVFTLLGRHLSGDWGDVCAEDAKLNDDALRYGNRLLSVYHVDKQKLYVISEADRSASTILLSEQY